MTLIKQEDAIEAVEFLPPYREYWKGTRKVLYKKEDIIKALMALPPTDADWVPITTSEPTTSDHVLVTYKWDEDGYETSELDYWVTKCAAEEGNKQCQMFIDHVIAWSFMPQPYREREKERNV